MASRKPLLNLGFLTAAGVLSVAVAFLAIGTGVVHLSPEKPWLGLSAHESAIGARAVIENQTDTHSGTGSDGKSHHAVSQNPLRATSSHHLLDEATLRQRIMLANNGILTQAAMNPTASTRSTSSPDVAAPVQLHDDQLPYAISSVRMPHDRNVIQLSGNDRFGLELAPQQDAAGLRLEIPDRSDLEIYNPHQGNTVFINGLPLKPGQTAPIGSDTVIQGSSGSPLHIRPNTISTSNG